MRLWRSAVGLGLLLWTNSAAADSDVRWHDEWPRFRAWEYAATTLLLGGGIAARYAGPTPRPTISGGVLFDDWVARDLSLRNEPARWAVATVADVLTYGIVGYRALDSTLVPGLAHDDWEVAQQMMLIDLEAYAVIAAALWGTQVFVGRDRPINHRCGDPEVAANEDVCKAGDEQRYRSFISGHVAVGVAAAGLTCLHHSHMPLYGGGKWDNVACGSTIGIAVLIGVGRTVTANHWASDVLLGAVLGLGTGWAMPAALHYGFDGSALGSSSSGAGLSTAPVLPPLMFAGSF